MQGRTRHPQLLHTGHVWWVASTLSPAPAAGGGGTRTPPQRRVPVGWGVTEQDGMEEPPLSPGAVSSSHPSASSAACSSRARIPPRNTPAASPTATRSHSPRHEASAWAWHRLLPRHCCQRGCYSHPHPEEERGQGEHSLCP